MYSNKLFKFVEVAYTETSHLKNLENLSVCVRYSLFAEYFLCGLNCLLFANSDD